MPKPKTMALFTCPEPTSSHLGKYLEGLKMAGALFEQPEKVEQKPDVRIEDMFPGDRGFKEAVSAWLARHGYVVWRGEVKNIQKLDRMLGLAQDRYRCEYKVYSTDGR